MSHDQSSPIAKLLDAINNNHLTGEDIERRLITCIEEEYAKGNKADIQLIDTCENLLSSLRKDAVQFESHKANYHHALDEAAAAKKPGQECFKRRVMRLFAIGALAIVVLMGVSRPWKWITAQSINNQQQYAVQGHEVDTSIIKKCIAEKEGRYGRKTYHVWEEVVNDLGFEPAVPTSFLPDWTVDEYIVLYMPDAVYISTAYIAKADEQKALCYEITLFLDADNAYTTFEQNRSGEVRLISNTNVYISENMEYLNFYWCKGNQVAVLTGDISYNDGIGIITKLIGGNE